MVLLRLKCRFDSCWSRHSLYNNIIKPLYNLDFSHCLFGIICLYSELDKKTKSDLGSFLALLSSPLNEKAGDFIQDELKKHGYPELKMAHGDIFHVLFEAGELSAKEIAGRTRRSKSTVSELVDRLVKLGYVCKKPDPADARGVKVSLTEKGVAFEAVFGKISEDLSERILSAVEPEELEIAEKVMRKLTSNF